MPAIPRSDITGLVLAGGRGSRMGGADKGLLPLGGRPLVAHVIERLAPQVGPLLINANRHQADYAALGFAVVADAESGFPGPLAGMLAGLQACTTPWLATAPCDSPQLPADLVQRLAAAAAEADAEVAIAATIEGDRQQPQPVFALLHTDLRGPLADFLAAGQRKIDRFTGGRRQVIVPFDDAAAFFNANAPQDLEQLMSQNAAKPTYRDFADFERAHRAAGFDQIVERSWDPDVVLDTHSHPFAVQAQVVRGRMWLTVGGQTRDMSAGDTFELAADVPHSERYGPQGAAYWVARRTAGA
jgi:molybdopterin-guanine dinucleotide biosynthesis protein A